VDVGDPGARELLQGCDAVLHFAGVPDPARARRDPARGDPRERGRDAEPPRGLPRARRGARLSLHGSCAALARRPTRTRSRSDSGRRSATSTHARAAVARLTSVSGPGRSRGRCPRRDLELRPRGAGPERPSRSPATPTAAAISSSSTTWCRRSTDRVRRVLEPDRDTRPRRDDAAPRGGPAGRRRRRHGRDPIETPAAELPPGENVTYSADPPPPI
jgi:hypothetical protein